MNIIDELEQEQMTRDIAEFAPGDTVLVQVKVKEGDRERLQAYEGVVIAKRNRGLNSAFTVRKISHGEGVERVFQTYSPVISSIEVKRRGDVRRTGIHDRTERARDARANQRDERGFEDRADPTAFGDLAQRRDRPRGRRWDARSHRVCE